MYKKRNINQGVLDRFIQWAFPKRSLQRTQAKIRENILRSHYLRKYEGACVGRRTEDWLTSNASANSEINSSTDTLRSRARDLVRNNPWANRAVELIESEVVGKGIMVDFNSKSQRAKKTINEDWKNWAGTTNCDYVGLQDFMGIQNSVMRSIVEAGEVLVRIHYTKGPTSDVPLQLEILEADFINKNQLSAQNKNNKVISGIEVNSKGQKVAYYLYREYPDNYYNFSGLSGSSQDTIRMDSKYILHVYRMDRPGQLRGATWLAPVMMKLRDFDKYEDAQIVKQQISACLTGFITDSEGGTGLTDDDVEILEKHEPGTINILGPGQDYKESNPPRVDGFKDFVTSTLHAISSGLGVTYEALTGDLSETNFSSAKMGRQGMEKNIHTWRNQMFYPMFLTPVVQNFLLVESLRGIDVSKVNWQFTAPIREMIQPDKEIPAMVDGVRAGFISLREAMRQLGYDPEKTFAEIADTNKLIDEQGFVFDSDARKTQQNGKAQDTGQDDTEDNNE